MTLTVAPSREGELQESDTMPPDEKKKEPRKLAYVREAKVTGKSLGKLVH